MSKRDALKIFHSSYVCIMNNKFYVSLKEKTKSVSFLLVAVICSHYCLAQKGNNAGLGNYEKPQELKKVLELKMPLTADDEKPGTRGASVVWHPVQKKYYAAMAGNVAYPFAVFDTKGKRLSPDTLKCKQDIRGLWYNPITKAIEGNAYDAGGWFRYTLDSKGFIVSAKVFKEGQNQPGEQCIGAFDSKANKVLFLSNDGVHFYDMKNPESTSVFEVKWESKTEDEYIESDFYDIIEVPEGYNTSTVVHTGIPGSELGFLCVDFKEIGLYSIKTGLLTKTLRLPIEAPAELTFNFAYTNGIYWLFDMEARTWYGYK